MIVTNANIGDFMSANGMSAGSGFSVDSGKDMSKVYEGNLAFVTAFSIAFGFSVGNNDGATQFANLAVSIA
ncbi:flagellin, partial [Campylobacter sp. 2352 PW]|nr:flagellin [Campylobacter sp. 2352 PW]